jgi:hypothetical protein
MVNPSPHLAKTYAMNVLASVGGAPRWAVDMHEGEHWIEVHGYPVRADADRALAHLAEKGFDPEGLRVRKMPFREG